MKKLILAVSSLSFLLCACKGEEEEFPLHEPVQIETSINLPPHPDFQAMRDWTVKFSDGAYSTWGVISNQKMLLAREVRVRGVITEAADDCPAITKPKKVKKGAKKPQHEGYRCKGLYVMIKSPEAATKSMMIVGYHPYFHPHFKIGTEIDVTGQYLVEAGQFMRPRDGLVYVLSVNNMAVDKKGNFTDDPVEANAWIRRGEALGVAFAQ